MPKLPFSIYLLKQDRVSAFEKELHVNEETTLPLATPLDGYVLPLPVNHRGPTFEENGVVLLQIHQLIREVAQEFSVLLSVAPAVERLPEQIDGRGERTEVIARRYMKSSTGPTHLVILAREGENKIKKF